MDKDAFNEHPCVHPLTCRSAVSARNGAIFVVCLGCAKLAEVAESPAAEVGAVLTAAREYARARDSWAKFGDQSDFHLDRATDRLLLAALELSHHQEHGST
jgi:hypothetical protein